MKVFRHLAATLGTYCAVVAIGAFAFVVAVTFVVSAFRDIEISGWSIVASQIARWFLFWAGIYAIHNVLPIAVAHGRTRREFLVAASGFLVVVALATTVIVWLGDLVERGVYQLMGWTAGDERGGVVAYFLMFLVWCAVGMFCAAAFDRFGALGVFSVVVGLPLVIVTGVQIPGSGNLPFVANFPFLLGIGWYGLSVLALLVAVAGTWAIARDMPVRVRAN